VLAYCVKDGKHHDAEEFLSLYLDALDEELVYIGKHKSASAPSVVEELEQEAQSAEGQTELGKQDYTVRQVFFLCLR
jgi:hypothetical protein